MCCSFLVEVTFIRRDVYIRIIWEMHRAAVYYYASAPFTTAPGQAVYGGGGRRFAAAISIRPGRFTAYLRLWQ